MYEALGRVLENRKGAKQITIDGYSNFLFLNRDGCPKTNVNYATMFRGLAKKYNKCHEEALPKVMTPHTLRHTFCSNLANAPQTKCLSRFSAIAINSTDFFV